jgi:hypothetical protein
MTRINFNGVRKSAGTRELLAWGKNIKNIPANIRGNVNALVFATVLIVCSLAVGCSSDKPKPVNANNQIPVPQVETPAIPAPAPAMQAENKPAPKKVVHRKPATVNYADKNFGVSFEYPRRYAIDTGDAAGDVVMSNPIAMNFVQPGGVALAAVELPETGFANTDFSSAFFGVSVNKTLTADQCNQFAVPAPKGVSATAPADTNSQASSSTTTNDSSSPAAPAQSAANTAPAQGSADQSTSNPTAAPTTPTAADSKSDTKTDASAAANDSDSKLMVGNLEMRATEAVSGEGTRQSDAKYFHVYQNGACYEFALNVTTVASDDGLMKHVNRDRVFDRLEKILATVKIDELKPAAQDANATNPATPAVAESPAK